MIYKYFNKMYLCKNIVLFYFYFYHYITLFILLKLILKNQQILVFQIFYLNVILNGTVQ